MFRYYVAYKHTFGMDTVWAFNKNHAKKKAIKILEEEFKNTSFPLRGVSYDEPFIAYCKEDLIEEIMRWDFHAWKEYFSDQK